MKNSKTFFVRLFMFVLFLIFIISSYLIQYSIGVSIGKNFISFLIMLFKVLPPVFILIGLFDVWVKREAIVKHLGKDGGLKSFMWVFLLAMPMAGGLLPAFPVAYSLYEKGARLTVILVFLGAVGIGRAPMVFFESSFLGIRFSLIRLISAIPLVIISGIILGKYLESNKNI